MSVSNMKELLAYSAAQKTKRAEEWNQERLQHGYCRGLNHREYMRMRVNPLKLNHSFIPSTT